MTHVAFDTLKLARALRNDAKMPQQQAEGIAMALSEVMREGLATKADLQSVKDELTHKIEMAEEKLTGRIDTAVGDLKAAIADTRTMIADTRSDTLKWVVGIIGFQAVGLVGTAVLIAKVFHG